MPENILITGASGFIGQDLITALLESAPDLTLTVSDIVSPPIPPAAQPHASRVKAIQSDLTSPAACADLLKPNFTTCYLLHGIMSGGSEANLDLGLRVNVDAHRLVLDILRKEHTGVKVVFPSSLAVYGPTGDKEVTSERTVLIPQSSYGTEKAMVELMVNDFSRRGLIDGRVVRLPTVIVRPGAPSAATSSFASGIVREPLQGEKSVLPVNDDLSMWVCSPKTTVKNLVLVKDIPKEKFGLNRTINLPGQTVTVAQILTALEQVGGQKALDLVERKPDEVIQRIVGSWPDKFDTSLAKSLGLVDDVSLVELVQAYAATLK
ncbi:NAD-dependent epimerase/dehydratase [Rhizodiscina lignyota]|uniref:NAD-dependent epimerase/dehydratase n=1 Tax=Rhizodiscina lignyota TaxID=1504668 RepID=A0A9P4M0J4_9PEZI|nr:NAD-dependent epimerase/dehydratase [Rhizodiscina lignyota]